MEDLELNVSLNIDNPKVKASTAEAKADIEGLGNSADATAKRVEASMQRISVLDQSSLDHLKKIREEKAAMYAEAEKSLQKSTQEAKNNLKNSADEVATLKKTTEEVSKLNRVKAESNKETKSGEDATGSAAGSMLGWISVVTTVIGLIYTYREAIAGWIDTMLNSKKANEELKASIKATSDALAGSEYQNAIISVKELTQEVLDAKSGFIDKTKVVDHYNETMGKAAGVVNTLDEVQSKLTDKGDAYIQNVLNQATANLVLEEAIKKAAEAEQRKINGPTFSDKLKGAFAVASAFTFGKTNDLSYADYYNQQLNRSKNADIDQLENSSKTGLEAYKKRKQDADAFAKANGLNVFNDSKINKDKKVIDATINERKNLVKQLEAIDAEYARKSFTKDAEEIQALRDKFSKMRGVILDFNKENPKKAISLVAFNETEKQAEGDLKYRQETNKLKTSLEEQKQLYVDYENFKTTFGEDAAKKRFGNEIKTNSDLIKQLAVQQAAIIAGGVVGGNNLTGAQQERLLLLQTQSKEIVAIEQKKDDELLKQFQSYSKERALIQERALSEANRLRALNDDAAAQQAIDTGIEEVSALDVANAKKWTSYKNLFDNLERMSKKQTLIAIAEFQKELNAAGITGQARIDLQNKIDKLTKGVTKGSAKDIQDVANSLGKIASEFNSINGNVGNIASVLVQAAQSYVEVKKGIDAYGKASDAGDTLGKVTAGLGIAGAAVGVATAVFGYFKGLKEAKEKALKAMKDYQNAAIKGELEYQALLRKREADEVKRGKNTYQAIIAQLDLLKKQSPAISAAYEKIFAALQGESSVAGVGYQHGTWLRKAKTWDIMASLAGSEYADLEKLYLQGKLKDQAKADFESLKALREELQAAGLDVEALEAQLSELLTGTTVGGLADGLKALFENGKFYAEDLGKSFTEIMRNALTNSFKLKYLEDQLQPFYTALAELMKKGTPTQEDIEALRKQYEDIGKAGADYWRELEKVTGIKLSNPDASTSNSSLSGGIRKELTEEGASILTGVTRNSNEFLRQILAIGKENQTISQEHYKALLAIATHTFNTVEELKKVNIELVSIKDNTAPKLIPR